MSAPFMTTRRDALKGAGALVVAFTLAGCERASVGPAPVKPDPSLIDAWLAVDRDGVVTVFTGKAELGQGVGTALAQIAAEELDIPFSSVSVVTADTGRTPDEGYTFGSLSVQQSGAAIGAAAAEARLALREIAAVKFNVGVEEVSTESGLLNAGDQRLSYGDAIGDHRFERRVTGEAPRKNPADYAVIGQPEPRLDMPGKIFGEESYLIDLRLPNMVFGRIVRPPSLGSKLLRLDPAPAERLAGVLKVVRDGDFIGVVAEREETAQKAADLLRDNSDWRDDAPATLDRDVAALVRKFPHDLTVLSSKGVRAAPDDAIIKARYTRPFQAHASLGASIAAALWEDERLTVWTHSQGVYPLRGAIAEALSLPENAVRVIHKDSAGCYGHNGADDAAMDAAMLARAVPGRPVKLQWTRTDEFQWEPYGPAMLMEVEASLGADGRITSWDYDVSGFGHTNRPGGAPGNLLAVQHRKDSLPLPPPRNIPQPTGALDRNALPLYDLENQEVRERFIPARPVRTSSLRSLGAYGNVFAIESFMDELAASAQADPVEFRLRHLSDERARAVVEAAANAANWRAAPRPVGNGRGRGFAFARYKNLGAYCAIVVDAAVNRETGRIRVEKIVSAVDCGRVVNPDGARNQIEGGAVQSASWTLYEEAAFENGRSSADDWISYPIMTFADVPELETVFIDRPEDAPLGVGEASQGPVAAAVANAVFGAVGIRLRDIPFTPERVLAAIDAGAQK